jgi:crossover junction endodeoxyribonuclease RuvC
MRVLGVDPGLQCVGYGILEVLKPGINLPVKTKNKKLKLIEAGVIKTSFKQPLNLRLEKIYNGLLELVRDHQPDVLALEEIYSHYQNPKTAIMMAHARGVICLVAAHQRIEVVGYAARKVKKSVTGAGAARKSQMQNSIKEILGLKVVPKPHDVADALAIAVTHINVMGRKL